jgi:ribosome maturation factor RimP
MREWFLARQGKRVTIETLMPGDKGGSYSGVVAAVGADAVVLQLPNVTRLIAFHAIESATDMQNF